MKKKMKGLLCLWLAIIMVVGMLPMTAGAADPRPGARSETNGNGDVFLGGNFIEVGISKYGSFGTSKAPTNTSFHPYSSSSGIGLRVDDDGWDVGEASNTGDFFLPGTEEERWILAYYIGDTKYEYHVADRNSGTASIASAWSVAPVVVDKSDIDNGLLMAEVSGTTKENVEFVITYSFGVNDKHFTTDVSIKNAGDAKIEKARFVRSFDPDMDAETTGAYTTYNKVICNPKADDGTDVGGENNYAMVVAKGSNSLEGFFFIAFNECARASVRESGLSPSSAYDSYLWDSAPNTGNTFATDDAIKMSISEANGYTCKDVAIALTFNIGTIDKDASVKLQYLSSLDPDVAGSLENIVGNGISDPLGEIVIELSKAADTITVIVDGKTLTEGTDYILDKTTNPLKPTIRFTGSAGLTHESMISVDITFVGETTPHNVPITNTIPAPTTYTVSFNPNGGTGTMTDQTFTDGVPQKLKPNEFTKADGYVFRGWEYNGSTYADKDEITVTDNITLKAIWHILVSFDVQGHGTAPNAQVVAAGDKVLAPEDPSAVFYIFQGWYADADCTVEWDFDNGTVTAPMTLYAKWRYAPPIHFCQSKCPVCGGCKDADCVSSACKTKCNLVNFSYSDVPADAWYEEAVYYCYHHGLMDGVGGGKFAPMDATSRAMIVTLLWRVEGKPEVDFEMSFEDVAAEMWYTEAVRWAASEGIVTGFSAEVFAPDKDISREQFAAILWRYAKYKGYDVSSGEETNILSYEDALRISGYAIEAMQWACAEDVISGRDDGTLDPHGLAKRCEAAVMTMRFCEAMK